MTSFVPPALAAAFTDRYRIERELGGGGMSRVFLAEEIALGRDVVIKVLAPELAEGISTERFAREVKLAARLQQANIVPLLSAGVADGVPWYTMPFVRGESLRATLAQAAGQWTEAREVRAMIVRGGDPSIMIFHRAVAELIFGERARAAELFVQSLETEGTIANVMFSTCDPILDLVRGEAAFVAFRARHGLSECPYSSPWPIGAPPRT